MELPTSIALASQLSGYILHGFSKDGALAVTLQGWPSTHHIHGTEADDRNVVRWEVSPDAWRRIAAVCAWQEMGYRVGGRA